MRDTFLALAVAVISAAPVSAQQMSDAQILAISIQLELNRLGCEAGEPDGLWGRGSRSALGRYAEKIGATDLGSEPTDDILVQLRGETGRLCTLPPGVIAAEDRAETAPLEAVNYSYEIWTTLPQDVITAETEYGPLRCEVARGSIPRVCTWQ